MGRRSVGAAKHGDITRGGDDGGVGDENEPLQALRMSEVLSCRIGGLMLVAALLGEVEGSQCVAK